MDSVEADGNSIDAAIDSALKRLGATRDRVEIEILTNAARGLFGIGGRKARVRATLRSPLDAEHPATPERPARVPVQEPTAPAGVSGADSHIAARAQQILRDIIAHMDVPADVIATEAADHIRLELTGDSSGVLIGRRGQMLDSLEYVLNRAIGRDQGGVKRIVVDSENYRARRHEALEELARRMGEQAKQKRKVVTLNPMSPRDRRIVHMILREDPGLTTRSSGKGYFRRLVIIPAGAGRSARGAEDQA
jgi:spoIIIJ-associated protein